MDVGEVLVEGFEALDELCMLNIATSVENLQDLLSLGSTCRRLRTVVAVADAAWGRRILMDFGLLLEGSNLKLQYDTLRCVARGEPPPTPGAPHPHPHDSGGGGGAGAGGGGSGGGGSTSSASSAAAAAGSSSPSPPSDSSGPGSGPDSGAKSGARRSFLGLLRESFNNQFEGPAGSDAGTTDPPGAASAPSCPVGTVRPFLPFAGVATDGGCDTPFGDFWVGHLFTPTARTFYSSEALTRNIHCVAVLQPSRHSRHSEQHRTFLLDRLQLPAAYLNRDLMRTVLTDQAWEGGLRLPDTLPTAPYSAVAEARRVLQLCATEVLEDLYVHCYHQMTHGCPWGMLLVRSLHPLPGAGPGSGTGTGQAFASMDDAVHAIHLKAWQIWHNQRSVPFTIHRAAPDRLPKLLFTQPPLQPLMEAAATPPHTATGSSASASASAPASEHSGRQQQLQRDAALFRTVGLFDTVLINRHTHVTCPLRCGALFAAVATPSSTTTTATTTSPPAAAGSDQAASSGAAGNPTDSSAAVLPAAVAAAAALSTELTTGLASVPCVQALDDVTDIHALLAAVATGSLPRPAAYHTNGWLEWVEFERPCSFPQTPSALPDAQTSHAPTATAPERTAASTSTLNPSSSAAVLTSPPPSAALTTDAATPSAAPGGDEDGTLSRQVPCLHLPTHGLACRVLPVLWFRFSTPLERRQLRQSAAAAAAAASGGGGSGSAGAGPAGAGGSGAAATAAAAAVAAAAAAAELDEVNEQLAATQALLAGLQQMEEGEVVGGWPVGGPEAAAVADAKQGAAREGKEEQQQQPTQQPNEVMEVEVGDGGSPAVGTWEHAGQQGHSGGPHVAAAARAAAAGGSSPDAGPVRDTPADDMVMDGGQKGTRVVPLGDEAPNAPHPEVGSEAGASGSGSAGTHESLADTLRAAFAAVEAAVEAARGQQGEGRGGDGGGEGGEVLPVAQAVGDTMRVMLEGQVVFEARLTQPGAAPIMAAAVAAAAAGMVGHRRGKGVGEEGVEAEDGPGGAARSLATGGAGSGGGAHGEGAEQGGVEWGSQDEEEERSGEEGAGEEGQHNSDSEEDEEEEAEGGEEGGEEEGDDMDQIDSEEEEELWMMGGLGLGLGLPSGTGAAGATMANNAATLAARAAAARNAELARASSAGASGTAGSSSIGGGGGVGGGGGAAVGISAVAVATPVTPTFPLSENLTALAPGIGHMYGWAVPVTVNRCMAQIKLKQLWCANMLLAKLISCEDLHPAQNASRGGCNIDAGIIAVQGPAAPAGLAGDSLVRLLDGVSLH